MMKNFLLAILFGFLALPAFGGPPEPPSTPDIPPVPDTRRLERELDRLNQEFDSTRIHEMEERLRDAEIPLREMDKRLAELENLTRNLHDSLFINDIKIGGDSIIIVLSNDSILAFHDLKMVQRAKGGDNDIFGFGSRTVIDEGRFVDGDVVQFFGDVAVNGMVSGGVLTIFGNIYVSSTGYIEESAVAIFGKVKKEPGGQIANLHIDFSEGRSGPSENTAANTYRVMAIVFLIIYFVWLALSATFSSLLRGNIVRIAEHIKLRPWKSFFMGYLAYLLVFALLIALMISILGIPLAILGMPLLLLAAMILSTSALNNLIGARIVHTDEISHRTFLYGTLVTAVIPGLLFLLQLITGSLVLMIFSWILIGCFIFLVIPLGLGAVLSSRFGTRDPKLPPSPEMPQLQPQVQRT
jgi:hypothetical protein